MSTKFTPVSLFVLIRSNLNIFLYFTPMLLNLLLDIINGSHVNILRENIKVYKPFNILCHANREQVLENYSVTTLVRFESQTREFTLNYNTVYTINLEPGFEAKKSSFTEEKLFSFANMVYNTRNLFIRIAIDLGVFSEDIEPENPLNRIKPLINMKIVDDVSFNHFGFGFKVKTHFGCSVRFIKNSTVKKPAKLIVSGPGSVAVHNRAYVQYFQELTDKYIIINEISPPKIPFPVDYISICIHQPDIAMCLSTPIKTIKERLSELDGYTGDDKLMLYLFSGENTPHSENEEPKSPQPSSSNNKGQNSNTNSPGKVSMMNGTYDEIAEPENEITKWVTLDSYYTKVDIPIFENTAIKNSLKAKSTICFNQGSRDLCPISEEMNNVELRNDPLISGMEKHVKIVKKDYLNPTVAVTISTSLPSKSLFEPGTYRIENVFEDALYDHNAVPMD